MSGYSTIIASLLCCVLLSCKQAAKETGTSFYYWKVRPDTADLNPEQLQQFQVKELYIKLAEISYNEYERAVYPGSKLDKIQVYRQIKNVAFIPVIFMTNSALQHSDSSALQLLAYRTFLLAKEYARLLPARDSSTFFPQLQVDCDWTKDTRDKYFYYLLELKKHLHAAGSMLSVTLRLYPYKYPRIMGIPPADRAMLMCYNLDNVRLETTRNSILDLNTLSQYLSGSQAYPLPLDAAMPVFDWYAWFRNQEFMGLLYPSELEEARYSYYAEQVLEDTARIITLQQEMSIGDKYFRAGDQLRKEFASREILQKSIRLLRQKTKVEKITFFHFDRQLLKHYPGLLSLHTR